MYVNGTNGKRHDGWSIVMTSFQDDSVGGDTNRDGVRAVRQRAIGGFIAILRWNIDLDHTTLRYGGWINFLRGLYIWPVAV